MSRLCMWSFDLRLQRYFVDGWPCFDYELRIPSQRISKTSYIGYDMKSLKMIVWLRKDHPPLLFEEIDSSNEMQWNPWPRLWKYWRKNYWWERIFFPTPPLPSLSFTSLPLPLLLLLCYSLGNNFFSHCLPSRERKERRENRVEKREQRECNDLTFFGFFSVWLSAKFDWGE